MKNTQKLLLVAAVGAATSAAQAGSTAMVSSAPTDAGNLQSGSLLTPAPAVAASSKLTGSLALDLNSHFISYGLDVWGAGNDADFLFNPALSIDYAFTENLTFNAGIWLDVNDQPGSFEVQETDIWVGAAYSFGIATASITWQNWQYAGASEEILDVGLSFDTILSPSITVHQRLGAGASGGNEGTFIVLGVGHDIDLASALSLGLSANVGFAATEFHTEESGYGFSSFGASLSYALSDAVSVYGGATYYHTDDGVVGNDVSSFVTYSVGMSYSF